MSINLLFKNIHKNLTNTEELIFDATEYNDMLIIGGYVSNISTTLDYIDYIKLYNIETNESKNLYSNISILPTTTFPLEKIKINNKTKIYAKSTYNNNLQLTLCYIDMLNYNIGEICIKFDPEDILLKNPYWRFKDYEDLKYYHNEYIPTVSGDYEIEFSEVEGWIKPNNINVSILMQKVNIITANYITTNSLISFYNTQIEITSLFKWRILGTEKWIDNNESLALPTGSYIFEFLEIENYEKIDTVTITVGVQDNQRININYSRIKNNITIILLPNNKKISKTYTNINRWRLIYSNDSISPWYNSDQTVSFLENDYTLEIEENDYFYPEQNMIELTLDQDIIQTITMIEK
jgi:hypothetical protein